MRRRMPTLLFFGRIAAIDAAGKAYGMKRLHAFAAAKKSALMKPLRYKAVEQETL